MAHRIGEKVTRSERRRAIRQLAHLIAVGVSDDEAKAQVAETFNVTDRTARKWIAIAYREMTAEAHVDRARLLGTALRRRRLFMSRAVKEGDWKTALAAAESEARLLGLNAPIQTEAHVVVTKVQDMTRVVVEVVRDFFADRPDERARFVQALQTRLNAQIARRPEPLPLVIDAESEEVAPAVIGDVEPVAASEARLDPIVDVAPSPAPGTDATSPA